MLSARKLLARPAGSLGAVALASIAGGALGGFVCWYVIRERDWRLSPRRTTTLIVGATVLALMLAFPLLWPAPAHASLCSTGANLVGKANGLLGTLAGGACNLLGAGGGGAGSLISGFLHALPKLIPTFLTGVLGWFIGSAVISHLMPGVLHLLVYSPVVLVGDGSQAGRFVTDVVLPVSEGALVSVVMIAAVWYWLVGVYSLDSGAEALTALSRAGGAVLAVPIWLWGVPQLIRAGNLLSGGLVAQSGDAGAVLGALLGAGGGAGATAGFLERDLSAMKGFAIGILLIGLALVVFLLLLMALKVVVAAATVLLFIAFPLTLMVYPLRKLEWLAEGVLEAFVVVLLIPIAWALILATMGVVASTLGVTVDLHHAPFVHVQSVGGWAGALLAPMVALVLLWMLVALPRQLIHLALLQTVSRRGIVGDAAHRTAVAVSTDAVRARLPERLGGYERPIQPAHETVLAGVGNGRNGAGAEQRARDAFAALDGAPGPDTRDGTVGIVGAAPVGGPGNGAMVNGGSPRAVRDMDGFPISPVDTQALERGIRQGGITRQVNPPSAAQVAQGFESLPEQKREAVRSALGRSDDGAFTAQMVRQSLSSEHPRPQREVFAMFAAAAPEQRSEGIGEALRRLEEGERV
jgi:hypothetical protein